MSAEEVTVYELLISEIWKYKTIELHLVRYKYNGQKAHQFTGGKRRGIFSWLR